MTAVLAGCIGDDPGAARQRYVSGRLVAEVSDHAVALSTPDAHISLEIGALGRPSGDAGELWWEQHSRGIEFGWTVAESPPGDGPLTADLSFDALVDVRLDGLHALLRDPVTGEATLAVTGLAAWDAEGSPLYARMRGVAPHRLQLRVEDEDAVYPITIDPILTSQTTDLIGDPGSAGRAGYAWPTPVT